MSWDDEYGEAFTSEMWDFGDKIVIIDYEMYKLDDIEKVSAEQVFF